MTNNPLRIAFMGTPDFAVPALAALHESGHEVVCVYSQPPRPGGRGRLAALSPVHEAAHERGLPVRTPAHFKDKKDVTDFMALDLDVAVVAAYGMLLPETILNAPKYGCINIHPSLLPRWRGPSPVQYAIWRGDVETGVSIMQLVKKMDAGPVIAQKRVPIRPQTEFEGLNSELWALGSAMLIGVLDRLAEEGRFDAKVQPEEGVTFCKILKKTDGQISWSQSAEQIDRQVRALSRWPGTFSFLKGKRIKILGVTLPGGETDNAPGTILDKSGTLACGSGTVLKLTRVQPENAKPMDFPSAVNGGYIAPGEILR